MKTALKRFYKFRFRYPGKIQDKSCGKTFFIPFSAHIPARFRILKISAKADEKTLAVSARVKKLMRKKPRQRPEISGFYTD